MKTTLRYLILATLLLPVACFSQITYTIAASPTHPIYTGRANAEAIYAYGLPVIEQGQMQPTGSFWVDTVYQATNGYAAEKFIAWLNFDFPTATTLVPQITKVGGTGQCTVTSSACLPSQVTIPFTGIDANGAQYNGTVVLDLAYYFANVRYSGWYGEVVGGSVTISEPL